MWPSDAVREAFAVMLSGLSFSKIEGDKWRHGMIYIDLSKGFTLVLHQIALMWALNEKVDQIITDDGNPIPLSENYHLFGVDDIDFSDTTTYADDDEDDVISFNAIRFLPSIDRKEMNSIVLAYKACVCTMESRFWQLFSRQFTFVKDYDESSLRYFNENVFITLELSMVRHRGDYIELVIQLIEFVHWFSLNHSNIRVDRNRNQCEFYIRGQKIVTIETNFYVCTIYGKWWCMCDMDLDISYDKPHHCGESSQSCEYYAFNSSGSSDIIAKFDNITLSQQNRIHQNKLVQETITETDNINIDDLNKFDGSL